MEQEKLEVLFNVHQKIGMEIGLQKALGSTDDFSEGHINGLKEANLRVEEVIRDMFKEKELADAYEEASCECESRM